MSAAIHHNVPRFSEVTSLAESSANTFRGFQVYALVDSGNRTCAP